MSEPKTIVNTDASETELMVPPAAPFILPSYTYLAH